MPRQPGVFYDKKAGCWATGSLGEVRKTASGKPYKPRTYNRELTHPTKDRRKAESWLTESLGARVAPGSVAADPTLDDLAEWFLEVNESEMSSESYSRRMEQLDRVLDWPSADDPSRLGLRRARSFTAEDIRPFLEAMEAIGLSGAYIRDALLMSLKRLFSWATEVRPGRFPGLPLLESPISRVRVKGVVRRAVRDVDVRLVGGLSRWMWRRALKRPERLRRHAKSAVILFEAIRQTGCRPKEMLVAEWEEYRTLPNRWGVLTLPAWKWKNGKKTGRARSIAVPPAVARRIEWIRAQPNRHPERIFTRSPAYTVPADHPSWATGLPWTTVDHKAKRIGDSRLLQEWFYQVRLRAKAEGLSLPEGFRLYYLRSSYATECQRNGSTRERLAEAMGTSDVMLARAYTDFTESDVLSVAMEARANRPLKS